MELENPGQRRRSLTAYLARRSGLTCGLHRTDTVRDAFKAMPVKSDRNDARGIAQLMRLGWFRPVHCKSLPAQETRALLTAASCSRPSCTILR